MSQTPEEILNEIIQIATVGATVAQTVPNPEVQAGAAIAAALLQIAQKAIAAHEQITGQPIELSLLHPIEPVP